jgi:hydrogenase nickel incorporation protein HypA/HybF
MHELTATQDALDSALQAAAIAGSHRIESISFVLGELSDITEDSVRFYFDMLSPGTAAEGAHLDFRRPSVMAVCTECDLRFAAGAPSEPVCPVCGSVSIRIEGGREFYAESIEVEQGPVQTVERSEATL